MIKFIYCNYTPYTQKEKAKAILFENANENEFKFVFEFNGEKYYKRVKKEI